MLIAIFVLHPACPPAPSHHGAFAPGISGELCHHGDAQHHYAAAPAQTSVQPNTGSVAHVEVPAAAGVVVLATTSCPSRSEHRSSGRALLLDLGISRT